MNVVAVDVVDDEPFDLMLIPDDCAVEEFAPQGPIHRSANVLATDVRTGLPAAPTRP